MNENECRRVQQNSQWTIRNGYFSQPNCIPLYFCTLAFIIPSWIPPSSRSSIFISFASRIIRQASLNLGNNDSNENNNRLSPTIDSYHLRSRQPRERSPERERADSSSSRKRESLQDSERERLREIWPRRVFTGDSYSGSAWGVYKVPSNSPEETVRPRCQS